MNLAHIEKVDPWSLPRKPRRTGHESFTDPKHPGKKFHFFGEEIDGIEMAEALQQAQTLIIGFVSEEDGVPNETEEGQYPGVGETVKLNSRFIQNACTMARVQPLYINTDEGDEVLNPSRYDFHEIVGLAKHAPVAYLKAMRWCMGFIPSGIDDEEEEEKEGEENLGNF